MKFMIQPVQSDNTGNPPDPRMQKSSQIKFTNWGDCTQGNRSDFHDADLLMMDHFNYSTSNFLHRPL